MSLSAAMFTGFTGIQSNSVAVDTVGDNLANLNTTSFKGQRTLFETLLYRTIDEGDPPGPTGGGTLPRQVGTGSGVAAVQRDFRQGVLDSTGFPGDLAVDGHGFFILDPGTGVQTFTRDGAFHLDADQRLVANNGARVQVFPADVVGNIAIGTLSDLVIPLGTASQAIPTSQVVMDGRLDGGASIASAAGVVATQPLTVAGGATAVAMTPLSNLVNDAGLPLFAQGDELRITASRGGISIPEATFIVGQTGDTVGDFSAFLVEVLGINTDPATGGSPGVVVSDGLDPDGAPAGSLVITSNLGEANDLSLDVTSVRNPTNPVGSPFIFTRLVEPVGGGVGTTTSFAVFDSLGNSVDVRLRLALESKSSSGTTWRFYAESIGDTRLSPVLGTGTMSFDAGGQFLGATGTDITVQRTDTGAADPLTFTLDFTGLTGLSSADGSSEIVMADQNGAPAGILTNYSIDADGIVRGAYSNQLTQVLGQIALATFTNTEGLVSLSENVFVPGVNSGAPNVVAPRTGIAGAVVSGALEQSNVEIAREFINLISASTGISSASRVVRAADDLLQELLLLAR